MDFGRTNGSLGTFSPGANESLGRSPKLLGKFWPFLTNYVIYSILKFIEKIISNTDKKNLINVVTYIF